MSERISLIINSNGRPSLLAEALQACEKLNYKQFEIIVVIGPDDDGIKSAIKFCSDRVKICRCPEANLSKSRNIGLSASAGDLIAFIDDDAAPHPDWLGRLSKAFAIPKLGAAGGFTIGPGGVEFQARKILCDRRGRSYAVADWFDERIVSHPGSALYPAPMGTNIMFRRTALLDVGGFDENYTYYLEETDLCLRLIDSGWKIRFEPEALVWHQFAASALRTAESVPVNLKPLAVSKAYFISRWANSSNADSDTQDKLSKNELQTFYQEKANLVSHHVNSSNLPEASAKRLLEDMDRGFKVGKTLSKRRLTTDRNKKSADWKPPRKVAVFKPFRSSVKSSSLSVVLVCRSFLASAETGIPRWTALLARGLCSRGHQVHIICEAVSKPAWRRQDGLWIHEVVPNENNCAFETEQYGLPLQMASFSAAVRERVEAIKFMGLDIVSFPIWDLEGAGLLEDPDITVAISLHTTYGLVAPWKPEWQGSSPLRMSLLEPMVKAETKALLKADLLLANSLAIIKDLNLEGDQRLSLVPHGIDAPVNLKQKVKIKSNTKLEILFIGRAEMRKGPDIALEAFILARRGNAKMTLTLAGCSRESLLQILPTELATATIELENAGDLRFAGILNRKDLEQLIRRASLVMMTSRYESFGLVALEAMAQGTPVLACSVGGLAEVVRDGVNGRSVPLKDAAVHLCNALLEVEQNRSLIVQMSNMARKDVGRFYAIGVMVEKTEAAMRAAILKKRAHQLRETSK
jgi:glycosyltransferase involved in cell wall biosynthesis/GT2 family glycosyltransferase